MFVVLCDGLTIAPGWLVIQQRYVSETNVDFNGNWTSYREGFGTFDKNFFLGLEKIRFLTRFANKLLVEFDFQNNTRGYAEYSSIKVSNENNSYTLSLGKFIGDLDILGSCNRQIFSTYDHGNHQNCAREKGIGWWHPSCDSSNLNDKPEIDYPKIRRMLIRPTYEFFEKNN
ncbi:ficolin-1-A-like [Drosophila albomicans]|uniref:Ficolin-1-A-like n=1 Tax=Drosophila albomicans TaxID=7291 RepID=A0A9C6W8R2_DROAB|nr:ficolin-1-A-like [Drosophila albomicans]